MSTQPPRASGRMVGAIMFLAALGVTIVWIVVRVFFTVVPVDQANAAAQRPAAQAERATEAWVPPFDHVIVLSIDGLRSDAVAAALRQGAPGFTEVCRGPHTLEARTDPETTVTLPNHVGMVTGRLAMGPLGHHWLLNDLPPLIEQGGTLHGAHGFYVPSMFDVAHDHGVRTGLVASKAKFILFEHTYCEEQGAPDASGTDDGRTKLDETVIADGAALAETAAEAWLDRAAQNGVPSLLFLHFGDTDAVGHSFTWDITPGSAYLDCVDRMDAIVLRLIRHIEATPGLRGRTALLVTTDHGGGDPPLSHTVIGSPLNYRIPFLVWLGGGAGVDLYDASPSRTRPRPDEPVSATGGQPIRNADAGNLALRLLGLPSIPESTVGVEQDLLTDDPGAGQRRTP